MWMRLLIGIIVIYLLYRFVVGKKPDRGASRKDLIPGEDLVQDPICRAYVPQSDAHRLIKEGKAIYFCSEACLEQYRRKENGSGAGEKEQHG